MLKDIRVLDVFMTHSGEALRCVGWRVFFLKKNAVEPYLLKSSNCKDVALRRIWLAYCSFNAFFRGPVALDLGSAWLRL